MKLRRSGIGSALRYVWAAPASVVGLLLAGLACATGARVQVVDGVLEVAGGRLLSFARSAPYARRFVAITFGHVVLGHSLDILERHRVHEHEHVRQYEVWGLLFFPLYLGASLAEWLQGRDPYWNNIFERQARRAADAAHACRITQTTQESAQTERHE